MKAHIKPTDSGVWSYISIDRKDQSPAEYIVHASSYNVCFANNPLQLPLSHQELFIGVYHTLTASIYMGQFLPRPTRIAYHVVITKLDSVLTVAATAPASAPCFRDHVFTRPEETPCVSAGCTCRYLMSQHFSSMLLVQTTLLVLLCILLTLRHPTAPLTGCNPVVEWNILYYETMF